MLANSENESFVCVGSLLDGRGIESEGRNEGSAPSLDDDTAELERHLHVTVVMAPGIIFYGGHFGRRIKVSMA